MRTRLLIGIGLAVGAQVAAAGLLLTSGWLIVRASEQPPVLYLMVAIVGVRFFGVGRAAMRYGERLLTHEVALARVEDARVAAYVDLDRVAPAGLGERDRQGERVRQVVADTGAVADRLVRLRVPWVATLVTVVSLAVLATLLEPLVGLVVLAQSATTLAIVRAVVPRAARAVDAAPRLAADLTELVRAAPDLLAFGATSAHRAQALDAIETRARAERRRAWAGGLGAALACTFAAVSGLLVVLLTGRSGLAATLAAVLVLIPVAVLDATEAVAEAERSRPGIDDALRRLRALHDLPAPVETPAGPAAVPADLHLRLEGLEVGWDGRTVGVRHDVDLPPGEVLVVTGPSGSGKSTLAATLVGLIPPVAGRITLGGVDLGHLGLDEVCRTIGLLGQDATVFDTTVRENLRIADPDASDAAMLAALDRAGLGAAVRAWPHGLDTLAGARGAHLSGGERQRLGLARLLLADHRILVLDEPTEHLDEPTADALLDDLAALAGERTLVVISHAPRVLERFTPVSA